MTLLERPLTSADVMTAANVADLISVPKSTVEDWARRGVLPSRKRGRRRLFLRFEVEAWLVREDRPGDDVQIRHDERGWQ